MKHPDPTLGIPLYVKSEDDMAWPDDRSFYLLTGSGLFLCRNHAFFKSCVPARQWPADLARHRRSLRLRFPPIPCAEMARIVGFFAHVAEFYGSEAAVLLAWDTVAERMTTLVPNQTAGVSEGWSGHRYPIDVRYEPPLDLPTHMTIIGDVHSHVDAAAYASSTDKDDETHRAGLHVVVGRISREPPEFHCEIVVDGSRFEVDPSVVIEGYEGRDEAFPREWLERVQLEVTSPHYSYGSYSPSQHDHRNGSARGQARIDYETFEPGEWT
jgi:hypothetical protein